MESKIGRPSLNLNQIESIVHKLEPYLKRGFSIRKACYMAQIPHSSVYELIENNTDFSDRIELFKQYKSILLSDIILIKLEEIHQKASLAQNLTKISKSKKLPQTVRDNILRTIEKHTVSNTEWAFLKWLSLYDKSFCDLFSKTNFTSGDSDEPISEVLDKLESNYETFGDIASKLLVERQQN